MKMEPMLASAALLVAFAVAACAPAKRNSSSTPQAPAAAGESTAAVPDSLLISAAGIGRVRLGMTIDEVRGAIPSARIERTSDGDGAALVAITLAHGEVLVAYADEANASAPVDGSRPIESVTATTAEFRTAYGVRVGATIPEVESAFGPLEEITLSEIEGRHFAAFERQPDWVVLRLNYGGIFAGDSTRTRRYTPEARILGVTVWNAR